jgi:N-acylglucosamine 2-epimerase
VSEGKPGYIGQLALADLHEFYRAELFDQFVPFMDKYIVDREFGGFLCHADRDGTNLSTEKVTWYIGRGIWVYSFLYTNFGHDKEFLEVAQKAVDFVIKTRPPTPGRFDSRARARP